ncbi:MAG: hypothetical protein ABIS45_00530 [Burkholderiales bacterium]
MKTLKIVTNELVGLFVDDGSLAYAMIGLLGVIALLMAGTSVDKELAGGLFLAGVVIVLIENVVRSAKR